MNRSSETTVLSAYRGLGPRTRIHTRWRWWTCPFDQMESFVPEQGRILDLGCGHGLTSLHLALSSPDRTILGVDLDASKVALGIRAARAAGVEDRVELRVCDIVEEPLPTVDGGWDAVVCNDVLYLLGPAVTERLVASITTVLAPAGTVVLKEMAEQPRRKALVNHVQETAAVKVLRLTAGGGVDVVPPARLASMLRSRGFDAEVHPLDRGYPHPHVVVVATAERDPTTGLRARTSGAT